MREEGDRYSRQSRDSDNRIQCTIKRRDDNEKDTLSHMMMMGMDVLCLFCGGGSR